MRCLVAVATLRVSPSAPSLCNCARRAALRGEGQEQGMRKVWGEGGNEKGWGRGGGGQGGVGGSATHSFADTASASSGSTSS